MTDDHADQVLGIYQTGIDEGNATFETTTPTWATFTAGKIRVHSYVALDDDATVLGWVAVSPTSTRAVYAGVVEHSVYVAAQARGQRVGRTLLDALIASTEAAGIWTIQSSIFPENHASAALHKTAGFRTISTRERIAQHHSHWRDTILIERRCGLRTNRSNRAVYTLGHSPRCERAPRS